MFAKAVVRGRSIEYLMKGKIKSQSYAVSLSNNITTNIYLNTPIKFRGVPIFYIII